MNLKSRKSIYQLKYGAFMLLSIVNKIVTKNKIHSYNLILKFRFKSNIEIMNDYLKSLYNKRIFNHFQTIRAFSIAKLNGKLVKFALFLQSLREKIKYRKILHGLNAFKINYFNKSVYSHLNYYKHSNDSSFQIVVTPPPIINSSKNDLDSRNNLSNSNSVNNLERRSSLSSFQQSLVKKFSEKISQDSKSGVVNNKIGLINDKNNSKINELSKRAAYVEQLKERQKIITKKIKDPSIILKKRQQELYVKQINSLFDDEDRKIIKYRNSINPLSASIQKLARNHIKYAFFIIKTYSKTVVIKKKSRISESKSNNSLIKSMEKVESPSKSLLTERKGEKIRKMPSRDSKDKKEIKSPVLKNDNKAENPPKPIVFDHNSWKAKLLSLGLNRFSKTMKGCLARLLFRNLNINKS